MKRPIITALIFLSMVASVGGAERLNPLSGERQKIDPSRSPEGINIIQILLENQSLPLKGTGCGSGNPDENRILQHQLALTLGYALDVKRHQSVISGECKPDRFQLRSGALIDAWYCKLAVVEKTAKGGFVASSIIDFVIKKDTWELYPELLRCR
jgi:hypothetical protein